MQTSDLKAPRIEPDDTRPLSLYFVNVEFPPIGGPGIWRTHAFVKYAARSGHKVSVFCSDRASWHSRSDPALLEAIPDDVAIRRIRSTFLSDIRRSLDARIVSARSSAGRRVLAALQWRLNRYWPDNAIHWSIKTAVSVLLKARRERPDVIFTTGPSHLSHLSGYLASRMLGTRWVMDYRDPWTEPNSAQIINGPYQQKLLERLERRFLNRADAVTCVSPSWLDMLKSKAPGRAERFHLIRNGQDLDASILHTPGPAHRAEQETLRLHFNGTIQPNNNMLEAVFDALASMREQGLVPSALRISFCGLPEDYRSRARDANALDFVTDLGALTHAESLRQCAQADALLILIKDQGGISAGAIPAKTYEAMALGKYIVGIVPTQSDTRKLLEAYPACTLSAGTATQDIVAALQHVMGQFQSGGNMLPTPSAAEHERIFQSFSRGDLARQLLALCASLAGKTGPESA